MGRHRRSAAGRAATGRATGVTQTQGSYAAGRTTTGIAPYLNNGTYDDVGPHTGTTASADTIADAEATAYEEANARSDAYLFASEEEYAIFRGESYTPDGGPRRSGSHRRRKRPAPVKTGLLGVSAAVALGTVAVATGAVPGLENYKLGGGNSNSADQVQATGAPTNTPIEQGGTSGSAEDRETGGSTSRDAERSASPTPSPSAPTATPTETPSKKPKENQGKKPVTPPSKAATKAPEKTTEPVTVSAEAQASAEVLKLVNQERAKVGCNPVAANSALSELAEAFSDDMAARGFFDHTDPDGASPWDRAAKAGITDLGGENIARGQADAAAVMDAWMNSPGHKANILNCDFKTLGVGVHFGSGGPWWTQDFGY
ncbi:CAP domain-containing protein [Streptomyces lincolnensis]|uniref:CAP domain-containing protein n=1 Tax=Streptomyces lincolnensis TaxID=1915 RepID=UPI001E4F4835|nr:CAP domain-containing protein [Streptomyces lincolnensis]MCD7444115.1 CAP domain-containing protein [Streptomyces lincolnensis]